MLVLVDGIDDEMRSSFLGLKRKKASDNLTPQLNSTEKKLQKKNIS